MMRTTYMNNKRLTEMRKEGIISKPILSQSLTMSFFHLLLNSFQLLLPNVEVIDRCGVMKGFSKGDGDTDLIGA